MYPVKSTPSLELQGVRQGIAPHPLLCYDSFLNNPRRGELRLDDRSLIEVSANGLRHIAADLLGKEKRRVIVHHPKTRNVVAQQHFDLLIDFLAAGLVGIGGCLVEQRSDFLVGVKALARVRLLDLIRRAQTAKEIVEKVVGVAVVAAPAEHVQPDELAR